MIAEALDRMATAAERTSENPLMPSAARAAQTSPYVQETAPADAQSRELREKDEEIRRMREEMDQQIRQLREENERLRAGESFEGRCMNRRGRSLTGILHFWMFFFTTGIGSADRLEACRQK